MQTSNASINEGRYDVVIFPNGGKECIGRIESQPAIDESEYLPMIKEMVAERIPHGNPVKHTIYYGRSSNNAVYCRCEAYAGEIAMPDDIPFDPMPFLYD